MYDRNLVYIFQDDNARMCIKTDKTGEFDLVIICCGHIFLLRWWQTSKLKFSCCGHLPVLTCVFVIFLNF